jgi:ECF sigma factor
MEEPLASPHRVTQLLTEWSHGDDAALAELTPLVYEELRRLAHHYMEGQRRDHTLQTTALVNEAYLRLADLWILDHYRKTLPPRVLSWPTFVWISLAVGGLIHLASSHP